MSTLSAVPTFDNVNGVPIVIVVIPPVPDWYIDGSNKLRCSVSLEFRFASASTSVIGIFCPDAHVPFVALTDNVPYPKLPTMFVDTSLYLTVADWPLIDSAFVVTRSDFLAPSQDTKIPVLTPPDSIKVTGAEFLAIEPMKTWLVVPR